MWFPRLVVQPARALLHLAVGTRGGSAEGASLSSGEEKVHFGPQATDLSNRKKVETAGIGFFLPCGPSPSENTQQVLWLRAIIPHRGRRGRRDRPACLFYDGVLFFYVSGNRIRREPLLFDWRDRHPRSDSRDQPQCTLDSFNEHGIYYQKASYGHVSSIGINYCVKLIFCQLMLRPISGRLVLVREVKKKKKRWICACGHILHLLNRKQKLILLKTSFRIDVLYYFVLISESWPPENGEENNNGH